MMSLERRTLLAALALTACGTPPADDGVTRQDGGSVVTSDAGPRTSTTPLPPGTCASVKLNAARVIPTVVLVVDQSGSMEERFGRTDRWNAVRDALVGEGGLVPTFENDVRFGLALYTGLDEGPMIECPHVTQIAPALGSAASLAAAYATEVPLQETPTGDALDAILDQLHSTPDPDPGPEIFLVATDGEPDTCEMPNPSRGQGEAVAAVQRAYAAGVRTYMLSVGTDISDEHMQDMANAGLGRGRGDAPAEYWVAGDDAGLRDALRAILVGEIDCTIELEGRIDPATACDGRVEITGRDTPLECGVEWRAVDETHLEILGAACDELRGRVGALVEAEFPCETLI